MSEEYGNETTHHYSSFATVPGGRFYVRRTHETGRVREEDGTSDEEGAPNSEGQGTIIGRRT